ncbi:uncharacterized protein LOC111290211 [Durio zibethinus]|uniref:Uncharacterized protein LOC111290211 n=1 Tax=Durio zibethinus TaxID=66656 RepID=A0A6P5YA52_DURZI|nr:uncharacterized protein LOC111290211 [Durio zibethinus]
MRRRNKELELEKRELLVTLYASYAKIFALSDMSAQGSKYQNILLLESERFVSLLALLQRKTIAKISELRHANGTSQKLKDCRRADLTWAEIQEHQTSSRKILQTELQKASDQKPQKITTQYPDTSSSSSYTSSIDSEELDSSTIESSSRRQRSISKNSGTGSPLERTGIIFRFSTSMTSMLSTKLDGISSEKNVPVLKDFTEETTKKPNLTKGEFLSMMQSRVKAGLQSQSALAGEKHEFPSSEVSLAKPDQSSDSNRRSIDEDDRDAQEVRRTYKS